MMRDLDGSLSETGKKNSIVTPNMDILDKSSCTKTDSWSHGSVEGAVCDDKVNYCPPPLLSINLQFVKFS